MSLYNWSKFGKNLKTKSSIPHKLLIAKMQAYGFSSKSLRVWEFYSYSKRPKQIVKIENAHSVFQVLLSGVPQGSILGSILFNIFIQFIFLQFILQRQIVRTTQIYWWQYYFISRVFCWTTIENSRKRKSNFYWLVLRKQNDCKCRLL